MKIRSIDDKKLKKAGLVLKSLNHRLRQIMISIIYEIDECTLIDIKMCTRFDSSVIQHHISKLIHSGIVLKIQSDSTISYQLDIDRIEVISQVVEELADMSYNGYPK